ncbi:MAG: hypothetical protein ACKO0M_09415 [Cyanobium sp.]
MEPAFSPLQGLGFLLASWAVIGNDALQTLGPFLQANRGRTARGLQAAFLCSILCGVLLFGWWSGDGDASWGRLASYPSPPVLGWADLLPPVVVLLLTRCGAPVSTSFLLLTSFTPTSLPALLRRSLYGYGLALLVAGLVYGVIALGRRSGSAPPGNGSASGAATLSLSAAPLCDADQGPSPGQAALEAAPDPLAGTALLLQWIATGWLWSQWLIQDLANIFLDLPRRLALGPLLCCLLVLCLGVGLLLGADGGPLQAILRRKSGLDTPQETSALSLLYGTILAGLAVGGREPLSTTWVFLDLLAGRELALQLGPAPRPLAELARDLGHDLALAGLGLAVSVGLALALQPLRSPA